jgi:HAD superfamily hydrolase (TIGR01509 family)
MNLTYGVIWDLDGTIVDTMPIHYRAWVKFMLDKGVDFTEEAFRASSGKPAAEIMQDYFPDASAEELHQMADIKDGYYREEAIQSGLQLLPGVEALLEALHLAGFKQGIGSGAPRQNLELFYQLNPHVKGYFLAEVVAGETANTKPHPEVFLRVAELIGVVPQKSIVIEDGILGIEAAYRGNMPSIAVTTTGHSAASFKEHGATLVVDSLEEISVEDIKKLIG